MSAGAGGYRLIAALTVEHDYFAGGRARHMTFTPLVQSAAFLRRFGLLTRSDGTSLSVFAEEAKLALIWDERATSGAGGALQFHVRSADAASAYYTAGVAPAGTLAGSGPPAPLFEPAEPLIGLLAGVALPLDPPAAATFDAWAAALGVRYRLRLQSRSTTWKYLLAGAWGERKLAIVDQRGEVRFSGPVAETLPDGATALAMRSVSPISLRERPPQRFELRDITRDPERVLIPRLPAAKPQRLWREPEAGSAAVSEIIINC